MKNETIKALTWKEPYASLMLCGKIETRKWNTTYRGLVLICAAKKAYQLHETVEIAGNEKAAIRIFQHLIKNDLTPTEFLGNAIAVGRLVDCRKMTPFDEDRCFVAFDPNLYCHVYEEVRAIEPFHWQGTQGWKTLTEADIEKIKFV